MFGSFYKGMIPGNCIKWLHLSASKAPWIITIWPFCWQSKLMYKQLQFCNDETPFASPASRFSTAFRSLYTGVTGQERLLRSERASPRYRHTIPWGRLTVCLGKQTPPTAYAWPPFRCQREKVAFGLLSHLLRTVPAGAKVTKNTDWERKWQSCALRHFRPSLKNSTLCSRFFCISTILTKTNKLIGGSHCFLLYRCTSQELAKTVYNSLLVRMGQAFCQFLAGGSVLPNADLLTSI